MDIKQQLITVLRMNINRASLQSMEQAMMAALRSFDEGSTDARGHLPCSANDCFYLADAALRAGLRIAETPDLPEDLDEMMERDT